METETLADNFIQCKVFKSLCIFALSQIIMLFILNFIPLGGDCEWASVCREWIEKIIGLS